ncbi:Putative uncharacterized protein [Halomonas sp. R57-5]|uniref:YagK/YfjJ domain-containing protein n=1 Tax=Halomonas sp. R57-5 TaxID=1610576 RepID=UPI0005FCB901|nr:inovirus-type Gp2 protein [Halomonas sp. R57-5]CEP36100.1 Putative uncharacterized protein [Halomonas sp. R57-5]
MNTFSSGNALKRFDLNKSHSLEISKEEIHGYCIQVVAIIKRLEDLEWPKFNRAESKRSSCWTSLTAKEFSGLITLGMKARIDEQHIMSTHPYLKCFSEFIRIVANKNISQCQELESKLDLVNRCSEFMQNAINSLEYRLFKYKQRKAQQYRVNSAHEYIDLIRASYSRIMCIRIDFSYRKGMFLESDRFNSHVENVKSQWKQMRTALTQGILVPDMVGYILRLEYSFLKGFHYHALIIYNGSLRQQDIVIGKMLGEHWVNSIVPNGDGRYFNCNGSKNRYRKLGVGTINYYEDEKYDVLKNIVVDYLVKPDDVMSFITPNERVFFKGVTKKPRLLAKGRPRKKL